MKLFSYACALALLLSITGCESTVGARVEYTVPAEVISEVVVPSALLSEVIAPVGGTFIVTPICNSAAGAIEALRYDSHLGCLGENSADSASAKAWIVPIPATWDSTAFCESTLFDRRDFARPAEWDVDELPAPLATDPQTNDTAPMRGQFMGCGGSASLKLVF